MTARIPVRFSAEVDGEALIDEADLPLVEGRRWTFSSGYVVATGSVYLHRLLFGLERGDGKVVDHINGNTLDNRRENLRICTRAENAQNVHRGIGSQGSRFRGVRRTPNGRRWTAIGKVNGRDISLGTFDDELEAARVARAHRAIHMPFATVSERAA